MGNPSFQVDTSPWDKLLSTNTVVDSSGNATVTGAGNLFSKAFKINSKTSFSFFVQTTAGSTGVSTPVAGGGVTTGWRILAANWDQDTKGASNPPIWADVTGDYGTTAGAGTPPGVHQFKAAFDGASNTDRFSSWVCPYAFIRFQLIQASGTGVYAGQFYAGEI